jgi:hypothetical protein
MGVSLCTRYERCIWSVECTHGPALRDAVGEVSVDSLQASTFGTMLRLLKGYQLLDPSIGCK